MRAIIWSAPLVLLASAGCKPQNSDANVINAWVRLAAVPGQPAAAYFTLTGGPKDEALFAVHADTAIKAEIHESMAGMAGMTTMKPLESVTVPADGTLVFSPGGKHVMLFGVNTSVKPRGTVVLTFVFKSGLRLEDNAVVVAAGDPAPKF